MKTKLLVVATLISLVMIHRALLAFNNPRDPIVVNTCSYVEINHVYNIDENTGEPKLRMTQYIWWEWRDRVLLPVLSPVTRQETGDWKQGSDFVVREYLVTYSGSSIPNQARTVSLSHEKNNVICIFWDSNDKVMRKVICGWLTKTHTDFDAEIENRRIVQTNQRNRFSKR